MGEALRLYGLNALVINAADGIGEAVARTLRKHGAQVLAVDVNVSGVEQHFKSIKGIDGMVADLRDPARQAAMVTAAAGKLGGIDILVCDYPLRGAELITDSSATLEELLRKRAELTLAVYQASLKHLKKSPAGRIINIGFLRSLFAIDGAEAFLRSERDLAAITRALAAETGEFGITVNYVQPGAIMAPASRDVFQRNRELRDHCIAQSAARRLGEPVDVAKVVLFLASDDSMFVSGTGIRVDGGRTAD
ncbi:MAG TPA: SDR family oxidoreductase [Woeseiaceae bacterium]|nr:SDR family oxidoreductase [Woeseiaceae bacterium]